MNKFLSNYSNKWYVPVLTSWLIGFICFYFITFRNEIVFYTALALPVISFLISFFLGIFKLFRKQYFNGLLQVVATTICSFIFLYFTSYFLMFYPYDFYADNLEIPENIKIEIPKDSINDSFEKPTDFKLYNGSQPGIYSYDICIDKIAKGIIFLKAFEVTKEDSLSAGKLKQRSSITVASSDSIRHYRLDDHFTIYEGDWERPYAARFEMWYRDDTTGKERKLTQKIYKIEGWMR